MSEQNYANVQQQAELMKYISDNMKIPVLGAGGGFAPIGTLNFYDGTVAPQGWLACDGTVYNISDYPELAAHYASHHGTSNFYGGNGTTTFAVPDLRGEFLRGSGTNSHENQGDGANVGVHQDGTIIGDIRRWSAKVGFMKPHIQNPDKEMSITAEYQYATRNDEGTNTDMVFYTSRPTNTSFLICVKATVAGDANAHQYSTEEQIVGTWIDGKTLYEKVIDFGALPNVSEKQVNHNISNIDKIIRIEGVGIVDNGTTFPIPYVYSNTANQIGVYANRTIISIATGSDRTNVTETYITIQYTKTTD